MYKEEYNNDFFGYNGYINRKNYIINMLILITIGIICSFIKPEVFFQYSSAKFLIPVLSFTISMVIFVVVFSCLSLVYRRIADITARSSVKTKDNMRKLFGIFFVFPTVYFLCLRYFIYGIPFLSGFLDLVTALLLLPCSLIGAAFIAVYKGNNQ